MTAEERETGETAPGAAAILKSAAIALVASVIATVLFVLPAEYGIDPTGAGEKLGLLALAETGADSVREAPARILSGDYPGIPTEFDFYDPDVLGDGQDWYYLVSAVDACGNEGP